MDAGQPVLNPAGLPLFGRFWAAALRPDLSVAYLAATAEAALTTVAFAVLGTGLSVLGGAAVAVFLSELWWAPQVRTTGARLRSTTGLVLARAATGLPRGVHEAVWGLLLVGVLGRDPLVGVLAIAIPFGAITAKVYAEILDEADHGPYAALRAAGAGRVVALLYGLVPTTAPALVSYAFYRFECSLRSAVILGMVGVGGLGFELSLSFQGLRYDQLWTSLYALVVLSALVDRWSAVLRRDDDRRRWRASAVLALVLACGSVWYLAPQVSRWFSGRTLQLVAGLAADVTPLRLPAGGWATLAAGAVETLQMSVLAAALATALGVARRVRGCARVDVTRTPGGRRRRPVPAAGDPGRAASRVGAARPVRRPAGAACPARWRWASTPSACSAGCSPRSSRTSTRARATRSPGWGRRR